MIFNLLKYLQTKAATPTDPLYGFDFVINGWQPNTEDTAHNVSQTGGPTGPWFDRQDFNIQFISRSTDRTIAQAQAHAIYNELHSKGWAGLTLPASDSIHGTIYPSIKVWRIIAVQLPGFIGNDDRGRAEFSCNYTITTTQ